jgi:hypothetical protein
LVLSDPAIAGRVPRAKIERAFDLKRQLKNIDKIFARVFSGNRKGADSARHMSPRTATKTRRKRG